MEENQAQAEPQEALGVKPEGPILASEQEIWHIQAVIYGAPGVGKTRLAATAPNPIFVECDPAGALSLRDQDIPFFQINTMEDFRLAWGWLALHMDDFETIVVDGVSRLQQIGLNEIVPPSRLDLERKVYGRSTRQMQATFEGLTTFPHHIVFTCDERLRDDEITHLKVVVPGLTPVARNILNRNCRLMGRLFAEVYMEDGVRKVRSVLQTNNDGQLWAKDTSGTLPPLIYRPNLTDIFNTMMGKEQGGDI